MRLAAVPLRFDAVTARQDAAVEKVVPLMGGVQNTAYDNKAKTLLVYVTADASAAQKALIRSEVAKLRKAVHHR